MAQKLAGGNNALALLCNTLPTGAILAVLILTFGPISGAHFNPAVSLAFALRRELTAPMLVVYIVAQVLGAILGVWAAHLMFGAAAMAVLCHSANRVWAMARGGHCNVRAATDDFRMRRAHASGCALCRRTVHHVRLLVHGFNVFRQSGRDNRALVI